MHLKKNVYHLKCWPTVTVDGLDQIPRNLSVMTGRSRRLRDDVGALVVPGVAVVLQLLLLPGGTRWLQCTVHRWLHCTMWLTVY